MIPFILHARVPETEGKNVALVSEVLKDEIHLNTYRAYMAQMEFSRPLTTTPGTSKARLEILRRAFKATVADGEFLAQANKLNLDITHVSGEESEQLVNQVLSIPPKVRENLGYLSSVK
jgi:hypothetical protein